MRLSRPLAWVIVALTFFTAGLLRQFHDETPHSPFVPAAVGSLLFAAIFFLLLVSEREWRLGASPGKGVRLGNLTPLLLMLLIEKWVSITLYNPGFYLISPREAPEPLLDAGYRAFAGAGLLVVCLLLSRLSRPAGQMTRKASRFANWPRAAVTVAAIVTAAYGILAALAAALGTPVRLVGPRMGPLLLWVLGGQALRAFAEELYYRGLLLFELTRLAPRLGARSEPARRWVALAFTACLFALEHLVLGTDASGTLRQLAFTLSLGLLFGMLVLLNRDIHFVAGIHAWINWLLLGAAPHLADASGRPLFPPGTYVGIALALAFIAALWLRRRRPVVPAASVTS